MKAQPKKVIFTFFKMSGCGHCDTFKGREGDPKYVESPWNKLTSDPQLEAAGVDFVLFNFGAGVNAQGQPVRYTLPEPYAKKVNYAPYLDLRKDDDMVNTLSYPRGSPRDYLSVKKWILENLGILRSAESKPEPKPVEAKVNIPGKAPTPANLIPAKKVPEKKKKFLPSNQ